MAVASRLLLRSCVLALATLLSSACSDQDEIQPADLVFKGGAIYTVNEEMPWAEAIAVTNGYITYVGDESGLRDLVGDQTEVVTIGDGMLMPGFHDAHMHLMAAGTTYLRCPLNGLAWPDGVLAELAECAVTLEEGEWLRATGLDAKVLQGEGPDISLLNELTEGRAALVTDKFGEIGWLNSAALELAGIDDSTPDPDGGEIVRNPDTGKPTGVLRGLALGTVWAMAGNYPQGALRKGLRLASQKANALGITSATEAAASPDHWAAFVDAEAAGEMTIRVSASMRWYTASGPEQIDRLAQMRDTAGGSRFSADSVKLFLDGSVLDETASLLQPYAGNGDLGPTFIHDLQSVVAQLDSAGFHIHMHAYGDRAVRNGLDAIEAAINANPGWNRRHQLAHVALIDDADLPRFGNLGVAANIQPLWAWLHEEQKVECEKLGPKRCERLLAFRDLFDSGARVAAGSDWISESMSPLYNIQVALTRRPTDGSLPAWNPQQRVTLEEMLRAYTLNGAWLAGQDEVNGSIEVGKLADLVLLEQNLFEVEPMKMSQVRVLRTFLEGKEVFTSQPN